jgi:hypothetical protein
VASKSARARSVAMLPLTRTAETPLRLQQLGATTEQEKPQDRGRKAVASAAHHAQANRCLLESCCARTGRTGRT